MIVSHADTRFDERDVYRALQRGSDFSCILAVQVDSIRTSRGTTLAIGFAINVLSDTVDVVTRSHTVTVQTDMFYASQLHEPVFYSKLDFRDTLGQIKYRQSVVAKLKLTGESPQDRRGYDLSQYFGAPAITPFDSEYGVRYRRNPTLYPCLVANDSALEVYSRHNMPSFYFDNYRYSFSFRGRALSFADLNREVFFNLRYLPNAARLGEQIEFKSGYVGNCSSRLNLPRDHWLISENFVTRASANIPTVLVAAKKAVVVPTLPPPPAPPKNPFQRKRLL